MSHVQTQWRWAGFCCSWLLPFFLLLFLFHSTYCSAALFQWFEWKTPRLVNRNWGRTLQWPLTRGCFSESQVATRQQSHTLYQVSICFWDINKLKPLPCWYRHHICVLSPANQNLNVSGHVEGNFALLSHGWVLFLMSVALIQTYLSAKLHRENKQCTTDTAASHLHFIAPSDTEKQPPA